MRVWLRLGWCAVAEPEKAGDVEFFLCPSNEISGGE